MQVDDKKYTREYIFYCKKCYKELHLSESERVESGKVIRCPVCNEQMAVWKRLCVKEHLGVKEEGDE